MYKEEKFEGLILGIKHRNILTRMDGGVDGRLELWVFQTRSSVSGSKTPLTEERTFLIEAILYMSFRDN